MLLKMEIKKWIELEEMFTDLMGDSKGINVMVDEKREVAPKKPIHELSVREDKKLIHRLRQRYKNYKSAKIQYNEP